MAATADGQTSAPRLTVAVLDFDNASGDPALAHWRHVPFLRLDKVKGIRVVPGTGYALRQMNHPKEAPADAAVARTVGEWIEARRVIWGNYRRQEGKWVVSAYIVKVATGQISGELRASAADWFEMRDKLTELVLKELGVTATEAELKKIAERPTLSPEALEWIAKAAALSDGEKPFPEIRAALDQALKADPDFAEAHIGLAAQAFGSGQRAEAEASARRALQLKADSAGPHLILGVLLCLQEKSLEAEDELWTAARLDPDDAEVFVRLGEFYMTQRWPSRAIIQYERAKALDPFSSSIRASLGLGHATSGQREKALAALQDAERLAGPEDANAEQMMSQAYAALREFPAAVGHTEKFLTQVRKLGANPQLVADFEANLREYKSRLQLSYVTASPPRSYTREKLRATLQEKLTAEESMLVEDPLASTPEMDRWARELTQGATNDLHRARMLFDALVRRWDPGPGGSRTAREVFALWAEPKVAFRCQEYARLFVALARAVGLQAWFTDVERDYEDERVVHACAAVFVAGKPLLVDATYQWFGVPHKEFTLLDDLQAVACHLHQSSDLWRRRLAVKLQPDSPLARFNLVFALMNAARWDEARQELPGALKLDAEGHLAKTAKGRIALQENRPGEAAILLEEAVALLPSHALPQMLLGVAYFEQGKLREAREAFRKTLRLPQDQDTEVCVRCWIAKINEQIGND